MPIKVTKVKELSVTNPKSLFPLLPTSTVIVYSGRQPLPLVLPTPSLVKVTIDKLSIKNPESDSKELIY